MSGESGKRELLVRFQDQTFVLIDDGYLLDQLSSLTGWLVGALAISHFHPPFVQVRVRSTVRGGKGGFGTLLKGQSRQAGAKSTTDWSACRDLQGRRLRHVNDVINYQVWKEWKDKVDAGTATKDEMVRALKNTSSGIQGWHLQLPSWADVSKSHRRQTERQYRSWKRQQEAEQEDARRHKQRQETMVQSYVDSSDTAISRVSSSVKTALQQGLRVQQERERQKRQKVEPDPPVALLTLSGDVTLKYQNETGTWQVQSSSNFCTVGMMLNHKDKRLDDDDLPLYWEVVVVTGGLVQVGWAQGAAGTSASETTIFFQPCSDSGDGVGDDAGSWAFDGSRRIQLHGGQQTEFNKDCGWKAGDVIGCSYRRKTGHVSFSINGLDLGKLNFEVPPAADETTRPVLFPAVSCNAGEIVELRWKEKDMQYLPPGSAAIGLLMGESEDDVTLQPPKGTENERMETNGKEEFPVETVADTTKAPPKSASISQIDHERKAVPVVEIKALDLEPYESSKELEQLGLDRLKGALMAVGAKCGGTLQQRAERLFALKGLTPEQYPKKLLAKRK